MRIDFYHIDAMEAPNYLPIWRALREQGVDARLVCAPEGENTASTGWFDYETTTRNYRVRGIPYATAVDPDAHAVTTQNDYILAPYSGVHFRLMYGANVYPRAWGIEQVSVKPIHVVLTHGPHYVEWFRQWRNPADLPIVGFPRFDASLSGALTRDAARTQLALDARKPVLAYFPTWDANSSLDRFLDEVTSLQEQYTVVLKPHHCTLRMEAERMARVEASGVHVSTSPWDLEPLLVAAEVVLADARSGALTEGILLDRPTVGLVADPTELDGWIHAAGVDELCALCADPATLRDRVARVVSGELRHPKREDWCERAVSYRDGTAARRAAEVLIEQVQRRRPSPRPAERAPRVTVVLPTYNHATLLPTAIDSVLAQTFADFELVIVDDGSTDDTAAVLAKLEDPRVRSVEQPNRPVPARGNSDPRVSVVLPSYNSIRFLPGAVQSVLHQTLSDFELVIVNDGSTDATSQYLGGLEDERVRVIHQENAGLPRALNTGFRASRGELLTWISADNYCAPIFLEALVGALGACPEAALAVSAFAWVDEVGRITRITRDQELSYRGLICWNPGIASFLYRRTCLEAVGDYDPELEGAEDWDMWVRIVERFDAVYVPEILYYYREHGDSITVNERPKIYKASARVFWKAVERNGGEVKLIDLYPGLIDCAGQEAATAAGCLDFGTRLLRAPFGDVQVACQFLESALSLSPGSPTIGANLAVAYARAQRWDEASAIWEQLGLQRYPELGAVHDAVELARSENRPEALLRSSLCILDPDTQKTLGMLEKRAFSFTEPGRREGELR